MNRPLLVGVALLVIGIGVPGAAFAQWTLENNVNPNTGEQAVFISRPATFDGAIAFVCINSALIAPSFILVQPTNYDTPLGRVDVTMTLGAKPPTTSRWSFSQASGQLRSQDIVLADVFAALEGETEVAFEVQDTFLRTYRIHAPVENLLELAPDFLERCTALPPMQRGP
ncbi:MAG: hypothetical protein AB7O56_07275 [Bauldia sp.]